MRAVSVLSVASTAVWEELEAIAPLGEHALERLGPLEKVVGPGFEDEILPILEQHGLRVLLRFARRDPASVQAARDDWARVVAELPDPARAVLHAAQRHATDGVVIAPQAWDPETDADSVRALHAAGLLTLQGGEPCWGLYRLHEDLPPPPERAYDFEEALMPETDDLPEAGPGPIALLHDLASLAAAIAHVGPRRTHAGSITVSDGKKLGRRLGVKALARDGKLDKQPAWTRALRALEALGVVSTDPLSRELALDLGLERTLAGGTVQALDSLIGRLVDRDLRVLIPPVREAMRQAGEQAVDKVVFIDLLREQHRQVVFPAWHRESTLVYPSLPGERLRRFDEDAWGRIEDRMVRRLLERLERLGLVRRAPGIFAATPDGRRWAGGQRGPTPQVWLSSDLELVVPPDAITPWERFQLERLGRCLARDVVDRYRLERAGLEQWLATHELEEAMAFLERRCAAVPATVRDTLEAWGHSAQRVVLTRGVVVEG